MRLRLLLRMGYFLFTLPMELGVRPHKSPDSIVLLFHVPPFWYYLITIFTLNFNWEVGSDCTDCNLLQCYYI